MRAQVFMISRTGLFGQAVEAWLAEQEGLRLVGCTADPNGACEQIATLKPDVVILDCSDGESDPTPPLLRFLRDRPGARIVSVGLQNSISIFSSEQRLITDTEEFLQALMQATHATASISDRLDNQSCDRRLEARSGGST